MHDIMPQACLNLTGFPELYSNGYLILKLFSSFLSSTSFLKQIRIPEKTFSIFMGLKEGDCVRKAKVKNKQCENPLGAVYANWKTCQIPTCLSHELTQSKIEYGIQFQFEYFILHLKSGLWKQIMKSILQ